MELLPNVRLEKYLGDHDVPFEVRVKTLLTESTGPDEFVKLGNMLNEGASSEEKERCKEQIDNLNRLIKGRELRLSSID